MANVIGYIGNKRVTTATDPVQVDTATSGVFYYRYTLGSDEEPIMRITEADSVFTYYKAFDEWTNRAIATYSPIVVDTN